MRQQSSKIYQTRGFKIKYVCADKQFQCLEDDILPMCLQIASKGEHVPKIERSIQTIKGDIRTALYALPFKKYPPILIKEMAENQVAIRNKFPEKNGISEHMGPFSILTGQPQPSYADFKLEFGQYVQTRDYPDKTNNMRARTTPAIALRSSGSGNGCYFMSLETGKRILRYKWTSLPIPDSVVERVHALADKFKLKNNNTNVEITNKMLNELDGDDYQSHKNDNSLNVPTTSPQENDKEPRTLEDLNSIDQNYMCDDISDLTISQRSKRESDIPCRDIFEESTTNDLETMESEAVDNENNLFFDTNDTIYDYLNTIEEDVSGENNEQDNIPYKHTREIDKDDESKDNTSSEEYTTECDNISTTHFEEERSERNCSIVSDQENT